MNDDSAFEVIDELKAMNGHLREISEALQWFNVLQRDRHELQQQQV